MAGGKSGDGSSKPPRTRRSFGLGHLTGLDGLRAIAVIAVLLYHDGDLQGGFLGVDVFFVISGFLITALLLTEWGDKGRIDVKRFWLRRARRLLPALFLLLAAVLLFVVFEVPSEIARIRADVAAAFGYVTNWYLILGNQSYFDAIGRPSPLRHLWSLAVEEQFYVFWPLILAAALAVLRKRLTLVVVIAGAFASAIWMAVLFVPYADPSRVYYGTDTRVFALLIGAALAFIWIEKPTWRNAEGKHDSWRSRMPSERLASDLVALVGLAVVLWFFVATDEYSPFLYQGGFLVLAIATAILIAGVIHPAGHIGPLILDLPPIRWIGERSYSLYLWHWPVYMFTRPEVDVHIDGVANTALRLIITAVLAEISFRFVENPIRRGALGAIWHDWRAMPARERRGARRILVPGGLVAVIAVVALAAEVAAAAPPAVPSYLAVQSIDLKPTATHIATPSPKPTGTSLAAVGTVLPGPSHTATPEPTVAPSIAPTASPTPQPLPNVSVYALGDSVMLGAAQDMVDQIPGIEVDAAVSRHWYQGISIIQQRAAAGTLPSIVVIALGNNDTLYPRDFDRMMAAVGNRRAVFVNLRLPHTWEDQDNQTIADGVSRYSNAYLADWFALANDHPEYFYPDGTHLVPIGRQAYTTMIAQALAAVEGR